MIVKQYRLLKLQIDSLHRLTTPVFNMDVNEDWVTAYPSLTMKSSDQFYILGIGPL